MQTSTEYKTECNYYPPLDKNIAILADPYSKLVKEIMLAMISANYFYEHESDLCQKAIAMADKFLEEVEGRS